MFGKFFASTFTGSMMGAGSHVFALWAYIIANTVDSHIEINPRLVAVMLGSKEEDIEAALDYLCTTDSKSRSKGEDGRRLVRTGEFSFHVVNHESYRTIKDESDRRDYMRVYMSKYRKKSK